MQNHDPPPPKKIASDWNHYKFELIKIHVWLYSNPKWESNILQWDPESLNNYDVATCLKPNKIS